MNSIGTATALFSGIKTGIKVIGLNMNDPSKCHENDRLKTIIDWAQEKGKRTGIVTTTRQIFI
jgi:alkaline phosphatase